MHWAKVLLWWHVAAWREGAWTVEPGPSPEAQLDALLTEGGA